MFSCSRSIPSGLGDFGSVSRRKRLAAGFTLMEVMVATFVMLFGITSSIMVIQMGFRALDTARNTTLAAQIMQSEMERIRLLPWDTTSFKADGLTLKDAVVRLGDATDIDAATIFPDGTLTTQANARFTIARTVTTVPDRNSEVKAITITVSWTGIDGLRHSRSSVTQYAKNGLYDYYYTKALRS